MRRNGNGLPQKRRGHRKNNNDKVQDAKACADIDREARHLAADRSKARREEL
jgi:hypothetical protein